CVSTRARVCGGAAIPARRSSPASPSRASSSRLSAMRRSRCRPASPYRPRSSPTWSNGSVSGPRTRAARRPGQLPCGPATPASPHFGERWARHWMDVVRYTDTYGYEWDIAARGAWRYRDYLIRAFNADVPFDRLVREHLAGDLLQRPRLNRALQINESLIGLM